MGKIFGCEDFCKCLERLGFTYHSENSSHYKYAVPKGHLVPSGLRPFMMVQMHRKDYDKTSCSRYISELKKLGFTSEQIEQALVGRK